ncbi:MAG: septum formation initiator family protein [Ruminococcaceae bacterium]|nr:septum formation initiator family protein [Oscillospiraceae bacterium]
MANTRVTTQAENPLCDRLKSKFEGRGLSGADARVQTGTFNAVRKETPAQKKVKTVVNPFEETAQFVRSDARTASKANAETIRFDKVSKGIDSAAAKRRADAYEMTSPFASGAYTQAYARAASIRARAADGSEARKSAQRMAERSAKTKRPVPFTPSWFKTVLMGDEDEVIVKKAPVSASLIIAIVLFCAVVMMIIFSFAQISEFKKEISALEAQKQELSAEIDQLALDIDLKNDIRYIEQVATEEIGMVKSNRVESRYISIAEGERIELPEEASATDEDYGIFSTMMSSVQSNWDRLMEYID